MNILFWNTGKCEPLREIVELTGDLRVDVLILAECPLSPLRIVQSLNAGGPAIYHLQPNLAEKLTVVAALPPSSFSPLYDSGGISIRHLRPPLGTDVLVVALHLRSKRFLSSEEQSHLATRIAREIERFESHVGHRRTIMIGDFNMNPFESGLVGSEGFHAMMSRRVVARQQRTVAGTARRYFYNPMWSLLGDYSSGPPGTYYYASTSPVTYFWNTFDQVLLGADLAAHFEPGDVKVIESTGSRSLLTSSGIPDRAVSDHLPILLSVRLEELTNDTKEPLGFVAAH